MGGQGSGRKRISRPARHTNYYQAFENYRKSKDYQQVVQMLTYKGMKQPDIDNWLRSIFGAGFIASGVKIEIL